MALATADRATDTLGARAISSRRAPRTRATFPRKESRASTHSSYQADAPRASHSSRNRSWAARTREARGAREHVFRYVIVRNVGNSSLHALQSMRAGTRHGEKRIGAWTRRGPHGPVWGR